MDRPIQGTSLTLTPVHPAWGQRRIVRVAQPAQGAEWKLTAAASMLTVVMSAIVTFTASAQAATRRPGIATFDGDGNKLTKVQPNNAVTASKVSLVSAVLGAFGIESENNGPLIMGLPAILLLPGYSIGSDTFNLQTEDQYGAVILQVEEFEQEPHHPIAALAAEVAEILKAREALAYAAG